MGGVSHFPSTSSGFSHVPSATESKGQACACKGHRIQIKGPVPEGTGTQEPALLCAHRRPGSGAEGKPWPGDRWLAGDGGAGPLTGSHAP